MKKCAKTMKSLAVQNHTHTCNGQHEDDGHFCAKCRRWWWERKERK